MGTEDAPSRPKGFQDHRHPWRTQRPDRETNEPGHGQFAWVDWHLLSSPASWSLTPNQKLVLIVFIGKYGKDTADGRRGNFQTGTAFSAAHVADLRIAKSTLQKALPVLQRFGFVEAVDPGRKASPDVRPKSGSYRPCDAWKATLAPTGNREFDIGNLPRTHDPRRLPELMAICEEMGEDCIWGLYGDIAVRKYFSN